MTDDPLSPIAFGPQHDALDAYLSAWVAALDEKQRIALGDPPDDVIWVPRSDSLPSSNGWKPSKASVPSPGHVPVKSTVVSSEDTKKPTEFGRYCPGCGEHYFVRWPFGWDAHAAHRCNGLKETDPAGRKAEFKARFMA